MIWLIVALVGLICILLVALVSKTREVKDQEHELQTMDVENQRLKVQITTLKNNIEALKKTYQEIAEIEAKKKTRKKQEAPAAGDSDARIERLNADGGV